jgi:hypothetical protein
MRFTVVRMPGAERALAELWTRSENRAAIRSATDSIDGLLRSKALDVGEARGDATRFLKCPPLAAYYDVSESDRLVAVWAVWQVD